MSIENFGRGIRGAVRGLWTGAITVPDFVSSMESTIRRWLTVAWDEGAADAGIGADELTQEELVARDKFIIDQYGFISGFADAIVAGNQESGGKLGPLLSRAEMWTNRYRDARNQGRQMAARDAKLAWFRGPTSDSCSDCLRYNGRVYRASTWARYGIRPQHQCLECHGFNCLCELVPTDDRVTPGRPPGMTGC